MYTEGEKFGRVVMKWGGGFVAGQKTDPMAMRAKELKKKGMEHLRSAYNMVGTLAAMSDSVFTATLWHSIHSPTGENENTEA